MRGRRYQTQWAGQFGAAHEMARRGYLVTFTVGNAPTADLLCKSPRGRTFSVQVKSLASKNYFLYQQTLLTPNPDLCFVFALIPDEPSQSPEYFVLNNDQFHNVVREENERQRQREKERGRPFAAFSPGIIYHTLNREAFRSAWHNLPA